MPSLFTLDEENHLRWDEPYGERREITAQEAQVVAMPQAAGAPQAIADALYEINDAIKELRRD